MRSHSHINIKDQTISGIGWSGLSRLGQQVVGFTVSVILARLLLPEDFGLIEMITIFTGFAALFAEAGLSAALIQRQQINDVQLNSAFYINIVVGLAITVIFFVGSPLLARFYDTPMLATVGRVVSFTFVIGALGIVPRSLLTKQMDFRRLCIVDVGAISISGGVAIGLAALGAGVWSLVASTLSGITMRVILTWASSDWRPRRVFSSAAIKDLIGFSSGLLGFNAINYWARNFDNLVIGKLLGPTALGIYSRAYFLMLMPLSQVTAVVSTVMFSTLSSIQTDIPKVRRIYLRTTGAISFLVFPAVLGLFVIADPLIPTLYGAQWSGVVPVFRVLCGVSLLQALVNPAGLLYTSQGRTDLLFWWGLTASVVVIVATIIGARFGTVITISCSYLVANLILFYPALTIPGRLIGLSFSEIVRSVGGSLICSCLMALIIAATAILWPSGWSVWIQLLIQVSVGFLSYLLLAHLLHLRAYDDIKSLATDRLGHHWKQYRVKMPKSK